MSSPLSFLFAPVAGLLFATSPLPEASVPESTPAARQQQQVSAAPYRGATNREARSELEAMIQAPSRGAETREAGGSVREPQVATNREAQGELATAATPFMH